MPFALLQAPAQPNPLIQLLPFIAIGVLFYLMIIRPQSKARKEMEKKLSSLKAGDEVILSSGFYATVDRVDEKEKAIWLRLGDKTVVKARRTAVVSFASDPESQA